ncbi:hypothetical protein A3Q56_03883 [Intoshia linei]|uniref:Dynein heavy chain coiled coil stalk domain-containing protein n=1 Tax=Intoshia linei TaxID=1819745 RepID=A0A177B279_9BILA|nr:hypothetical protein A3Q56_03883 [Intoshia linei]
MKVFTVSKLSLDCKKLFKSCIFGCQSTGKRRSLEFCLTLSGIQQEILPFSSSYSYENFKHDFENLVKNVVFQDKKKVLVITDNDIINDAILSDILSILNGIEIENFYDQEKQSNLYLLTKEYAILIINDFSIKSNMTVFFDATILSKLTIIHFKDLTSQTIENISIHYLNEYIDSDLTKYILNYRYKIVNCFYSMHQIAMKKLKEKNKFDKSFFSIAYFIEMFCKNFNYNAKRYLYEITTLRKCLKSLNESNKYINKMQYDLVDVGPKIKLKAIETDNLINNLNTQKNDIKKVLNIINNKQSIMKSKISEIQEQINCYKSELDSAQPKLDIAMKNLKKINKINLSELKLKKFICSFYIVKEVMFSISILFNKAENWLSVKSILSDNKFMEKIKKYNKSNINKKMINKLKKYTRNPKFNIKDVGSVSNICKYLCEWVLAIENNYEVKKDRIPKERLIKETEEILLKQNDIYEKHNCLKKSIDVKLKLINAAYQQSFEDKKNLNQEKNNIEMKISRAQKILFSLSNEKELWIRNLDTYEKELSTIVGDILLSSGYITYLGCFDHDDRLNTLQKWQMTVIGKSEKKSYIPCRYNYNFIKSMINQQTINGWVHNGLSNDEESIENGIIMDLSHKVPLLIDPHYISIK